MDTYNSILYVHFTHIPAYLSSEIGLLYKGKLLLPSTVSITMSASNISTTQNRLNELNREFEYLFQSVDDDNIKKCLTAEIIKEIRILTFKKFFKILLLIVFVITQIYVIPFLNWNASAIGRIVMIEMLKIWDWRHLYNVDCLIERHVEKTDFIQSSIGNIEDDCSFCEKIGKIIFKKNFCHR